MNPKFFDDPRPIIWTVSREIPDTYCLYLGGKLAYENLPFEQFYPIYQDCVRSNKYSNAA